MSSSGADAVPSSQSVETMLRPVRSMLASLVRSEALERGDIGSALAQFTEAAAAALRVERASVWRFDETGTQLACLDLFERTAERHSSGVVLRAAATPDYFRALTEERSIAAHDARTDPRTREFTTDYLLPNRITSMLDAPVVVGARVVGVVCHEHVGPARVWAPWEELVAGTFADFVSMAILTADRVRQARSLEQYGQKLEHLVDERTRELRVAEERFHKLFDAAPVALILSRIPDGKVLTANPCAAAMFGVPPALWSEKSAPDFWVESEDYSRFRALVREKEIIDSFQTRLRDAAGREFWADVDVRRLVLGGERSILYGVRDITAQKTAEKQLRILATTDALTGALNRRRIFEVATEELLRAHRYGRPLSIAMIDLDHFKSVNDRFGHAAGDDALQEVVRTLRAGLRCLDHIGRYGGEEMMVVFPETPAEAARVVVERARQAVEALDLRFSGERAPLTMSAGVVAARDKELGTLLPRADAALYDAKSSGRNRVVVA